MLPLPIQHNQPNQANQDSHDVDPRDFILEKENRHRDEEQRSDHVDHHRRDPQVPAGPIGEQKPELDADDGNRQPNARPVQLFQLDGQPIFEWKEKEGQQDDPEGDRVGHQQGNGKVHVRWRAFGREVIQRAGADGEGDGKVKKGHGFFHYRYVTARRAKPDVAVSTNLHALTFRSYLIPEFF
jgi:hypothetical protein